MRLDAPPNLKAVKARAYYIEIEETTESKRVEW
jgi:hypothetical protein